MAFTQKPLTREGILIFGDGDEASFITCAPSTYEGRIYFKFRPTQQMRWKKQIPEDHFHSEDRTLNRTYKKELCMQLSYDPDFPMWLILCDYHGNEETPLMDNLIRCKQLITRNRDIEKENRLLLATVNRIRKQTRRQAEHPSEDERDKLNFVERVNKRTQPIYSQPPADMFGSEE